MAKTTQERGLTAALIGELLAQLPRIEFEKQDVSDRLQEIPFETQLLTLSDVSIEQETIRLHDILWSLGKLKEQVYKVVTATLAGLKDKRVAPDQTKVGRNDPCPCGSGRKYKKCHGVGH